MDAFLTGGSGFAGAAIARRLVADGHIVHALARSPMAAEAVAAAGALPIHGDLDDLVDTGEAGPGGQPPSPGHRWAEVLDKVDVVVHAAAFMEFWGPMSCSSSAT